MDTNHLKQRLNAGEVILNGWLSIPSAVSAEVIALAGYDSVTVDLQHGVHDYASMLQCFYGIDRTAAAPLVRLAGKDATEIGKVLDAGAVGIICPMIDTAEETAALVAACRYLPVGRRSNGPIRAARYSTVPTYQQTANDEIICLPMIETVAAVDNLEAILDVPGIDGVYVGPSDLSWGMGFKPGSDREEPEMLALFERILEATHRRGLFAGIQCASASYAARAARMGFRLVTVMTDTSLLLSAARAALAEVRAGTAGTAN